MEPIIIKNIDLNKHINVVSSGIFYPWGDELKEYFDYVICLDTDAEIRKKRLIEREWRMFGDRILVGGDMHEQFNRFLKWALNYVFFYKRNRTMYCHEY